MLDGLRERDEAIAAPCENLDVFAKATRLEHGLERIEPPGKLPRP